MSYYDDQMRKLLARRAGDWLVVHRRPRLRACCGICIWLLAAYGASDQLVFFDLQHASLRFAINSICGYCAFLAFMGAWLASVTSMPAKSLVPSGVNEIRTEVPGNSSFDDWIDEGVTAAIRESSRQAGNPLALLLAIGTLGLVFLGIYFVVHAPWFLGKMMVDGGKVQHRSTPSGRTLDCIILPFLQTWPAALMVLIHYATIGAVLQQMLHEG